MKLRDPGTHVDSLWTRTTFLDEEVLQLRVTYDQAVGSDTWCFCVDPELYALVGYRFFHDESANDGEYLALEGEVAVGTMRLPARHTWYRNDNHTELGTDVLTRYEPVGC